MQELIPVHWVFRGIIDHMKLKNARNSVAKSTAHEGNVGALQNALSQKASTRMKFVAIKFHFFKSDLGNDIQLVKIDSSHQNGDVFKKCMLGEKSSASAGVCAIGELERRGEKQCG